MAYTLPVRDEATLDSLVHHHVLTGVVRDGHAPAPGELAAALEEAPDRIAGSLRRLHDGHGLVLHPDASDVWIAHPFSLSPTATWVAADGGRGWWAPCIWCAAGVAALAAPTATIHARAGGEAEPIAIALVDGRVVGTSPVVHFPIPPRDAWSNVVHFCASVLPFRRAGDVDAWCQRHRVPRGEVVSMAQALDLGRAWYGRHLDRDWRKWTIAEAQAIFDEVGLTGDFWRLPTGPGRF